MVQHRHFATAVRLPHPRRIVPTGGGHIATIGTKGHGADLAIVVHAGNLGRNFGVAPQCLIGIALSHLWES